MKQFYLIFCLAFTFTIHSQVIDFPDANFKAKLMLANVAFDIVNNEITIDSNSDGEIEVSEVQNVYSLDVSSSTIVDLTGISNFSSLKILTCNNNLLNTIVIDNSISLMALNASHNSLTSISINFDSTVEGFDLSYNNLQSFIAQDTYYADGFDLTNNQLTNLTLNNCIFYSFSVDNNNLSSIQFIGNVFFFSWASFTNNQFSLLDLSNSAFDPSCTLQLGNNPVDNVLFPEASQPNIFYVSNNTFFDLGNYHATTNCDPEDSGRVTISYCPNLQTLVLKNGINHATITCNEGGTIFDIPAMNLSISGCPNLSYICVDELEQPYIQSRINQLGLQDQVQVNNYCTFLPGGTYYTANGITQFDSDSNGCDSGDFHVPNQKFTITNETETGTIISSNLGNYSINIGQGTHTITPIVDNPAAFTILPTNVTVDFPLLSSPAVQNFCISGTTPTHDFDITLIPISPARPGFDASYTIVFKNTGNMIDDGNIVLTYQDDSLDFISTSVVPSSNSGGNLSWAFTNLTPFETRIINVTFNLNSPMEIPPLNAGDVLNFTTSIAENGATQSFSNNHLLNQTVVNSFDPNDKICLEGQNLSNDFIGNYVSYRIRFENTGTFVAENIVIKDLIDMSKFDISTLQPILGSHYFYTKITSNKVEFIFQNINLPFDDANNDGYVVFKIKLLPSVTENSSFANQASIYFDYNFPIVTNTATSTIGTLVIPTHDFTNQFTVFPVPAMNVLQIQSMDNLEIINVEIFNSLGQIIQKEIGNQQSMDVSRLSRGIYYLKISTSDVTSVVQFLKE